ncbi:hypothetical protein BDV25DRAFT_135694 [Aspergillus avenaceus]|uniref:Uncharacterized protein n=1 Tax=Aspergillus avenaceus TaxID=36643 RepID=A0A5N6U795_ASPAV|nr:hypothetical protein BDV25DRAFT_135694 [Aspergillus avenaceus]
MRLLPVAAALLSMSQLGLAAPVTEDAALAAISKDLDINELNSLVLRSPNDAHNTLAHLENRDTCTRSGIMIRIIKSTTAQLAFLNIGANIAAEICEHYHDDNCAFWVKIIKYALNAVFLAAQTHGQADGSVGVSPDAEQQSIQRRALESAFADTLGGLLRESGYDYDHMEHFEASGSNYQKRDSDEPDLQHRYIVRGMKNEEFTHDIAFNHYSNEDVVLHLGGMNETLSSDPHADLEKRFSQVGFKVTFATKKASSLSQADQEQMSESIAKDWQVRAASGSTKDYIGFVEDGHTADFYYRIIPEVEGFGLNYESVDVTVGILEDIVEIYEIIIDLFYPYIRKDGSPNGVS